MLSDTRNCNASVNLRKLAAGQPCMIRVPGVCSGDTAETVLCHVRMIDVSGMNLRAADLLGA